MKHFLRLGDHGFGIEKIFSKAEIIFSVMETVFPVVETTGSATLTVVSFQKPSFLGRRGFPAPPLAISAAKIEMDSPGNRGVWRAGRARSQINFGIGIHVKCRTHL